MTWQLGRPAKRDANHKPLTAFLRDIGWWYLDTSHFSGLGCDILTRHKDRYPLLIEFKAEGKLSDRDLTPSEKALRAAFPEFFRVVQTRQQLAAAIGWSP